MSAPPKPHSPLPDEFQNLDYVDLEQSPRRSSSSTSPKIFTRSDSHPATPTQITIDGMIYPVLPSLEGAPPPYPFGTIPDLENDGQNVQGGPMPISHVVILPCSCNGPCSGGLYQFLSPAEFQHRRRMAYITVLIFMFVAIACIIFFFKVHATIEQSYEEAVRSLETKNGVH